MTPAESRDDLYPIEGTRVRESSPVYRSVLLRTEVLESGARMEGTVPPTRERIQATVFGVFRSFPSSAFRWRDQVTLSPE